MILEAVLQKPRLVLLFDDRTLWLLVIEAVNKPTRSSLVLLALKIVCQGTVYSLLLYLCAAPILIHVDVAHGLLQYYFHLDGIRYIMYLAHLQLQSLRAHWLFE